MFPKLTVLASLIPTFALAQFEPESAHVILYFPQLADGGNRTQSWQTSFIFQNSNPSFSTDCTLNLKKDDGTALSLDLGNGSSNIHRFTIPPHGRRTFRSRVLSSVTVTGWARADCSIPVQGTVLFRAIQNGAPQVEISASGISPSSWYRSAANPALGVALGNIYTDSVLSLTMRAFDSEGTLAASKNIQLCGLCHTSFNLSDALPGLPQNFEGTLEIISASPSWVFAAWTLNAERGLLSSLPPGGLSWPISHYDRIWLVFRKVWTAAQSMGADPALSLGTTPPALSIVREFRGQRINAFATASEVTITLC